MEEGPAGTDEYVNIEKLKKKVRHFVRERDWEKYHTPKDLAIAISVEAGELLEIFQWIKENEVEKVKENRMMMERIESDTTLKEIISYLEDGIMACNNGETEQSIIYFERALNALPLMKDCNFEGFPDIVDLTESCLRKVYLSQFRKKTRRVDDVILKISTPPQKHSYQM